ncbi:MAG: hypothetical protein LBI47_01170 [Puniceicoccales bacterium]|jgi:hypothetical protein|nr:hypothetical protein [Puniceicoccales bacterium]
MSTPVNYDPGQPINNTQGSQPKSRIASVNPTITQALNKSFGLKTQGSLNVRTAETLDTPSDSTSESSGSSEMRESGEPVDDKQNPETEFTNLINELNAGKYKVSYFTRFFTWLKKFFCKGYDRNTDLAKRAFNEIQNKSDFLKAAFDFIALPGNEASIEENTKNLLKFCPSTSTNEIIGGFCTISNPIGKLAVFDALVKEDNHFNLNSLSQEQVSAFAGALLAAKGGEGGESGADKLAELVIHNRWSVENFPT